MGAKASAPKVELGHVASNGISPSLFALVEHGASKRPGVVRGMRGLIELRFHEDFAPVRLSFEEDGVHVEDLEPGAGSPPADAVISGSLPDVVQLAAAPQAGGLPKLTDPKGRAALASVARGRVTISGKRLLARRLMKLLEL